MKRYFILNWVLQIAVIFVAFYGATLLAGIEREMLPIVVTALVFGTFTTAASNFVLYTWIKRENVLFTHENDKTERP